MGLISRGCAAVRRWCAILFYFAFRRVVDKLDVRVGDGRLLKYSSTEARPF